MKTKKSTPIKVVGFGKKSAEAITFIEKENTLKGADYVFLDKEKAYTEEQIGTILEDETELVFFVTYANEIITESLTITQLCKELGIATIGVLISERQKTTQSEELKSFRQSLDGIYVVKEPDSYPKVLSIIDNYISYFSDDYNQFRDIIENPREGFVTHVASGKGSAKSRAQQAITTALTSAKVSIKASALPIKSLREAQSLVVRVFSSGRKKAGKEEIVEIAESIRKEIPIDCPTAVSIEDQTKPLLGNSLVVVLLITVKK